MNKLKIIQILENIADMLELQGDRFRPRAYRNAARTLETTDEDIEALSREGKLTKLPAIGEHIAKKITELVDTGKLQYYTKLKKKTKIDVEGLNAIPSLGPKKMKVLYDKLKIKNVKDLERAIKKKKLRELEGFGEETEKKFLQGIDLVKLQLKRLRYNEIKPIALNLKKTFEKHPAVEKIVIAGSFRRYEKTIGDLDMLIITKKPKEVTELFTTLPDVKEVLAQGTTRSSILLKNNLQVDLRIFKKKEFGSGLLYFTGSKQHNIRLRQVALKQGMTLNEYGLFRIKDKKWIAGRTEEAIYKKLGLQFVKPEERKR